MKKKQARNGFVLVYTVLVLSIMLIIGGIFADTVVKEVGISRDEAESLKAFYAADSAVECVRYLQNNFSAFDTTQLEDTYSCGIGNSFPAGGDPPSSQCTADTRTFTLGGFSNGSCAVVTVNVIPRTIVVGGAPLTVCDVDVIANGRNTCSGSGKVVERTRWETI
jgi:hypothetical protein